VAEPIALGPCAFFDGMVTLMPVKSVVVLT